MDRSPEFQLGCIRRAGSSPAAARAPRAARPPRRRARLRISVVRCGLPCARGACNGMILCLRPSGNAMKRPRRTFLHLAAAAAALSVASGFVLAQTYPTRPVRLIVPFGPAGATDIAARLIGQWLSERLGQQFVIENRPGAGGNVGTEAVVRAGPDGYTLGLFGAPSAINARLYDKLNFNFVPEIPPVAPIVRFPYIIVVNPSVPAKTLPELIAYAKANPDKINMASPGIGSVPHVNGELFKVMTGTNLVHVPYRSAAAVMTDLLSGQVQL